MSWTVDVTQSVYATPALVAGGALLATAGLWAAPPKQGEGPPNQGDGPPRHGEGSPGASSRADTLVAVAMFAIAAGPVLYAWSAGWGALPFDPSRLAEAPPAATVGLGLLIGFGMVAFLAAVYWLQRGGPTWPVLAVPGVCAALTAVTAIRYTIDPAASGIAVAPHRGVQVGAPLPASPSGYVENLDLAAAQGTTIVAAGLLFAGLLLAGAAVALGARSRKRAAVAELSVRRLAGLGVALLTFMVLGAMLVSAPYDLPRYALARAALATIPAAAGVLGVYLAGAALPLPRSRTRPRPSRSGPVWRAAMDTLGAAACGVAGVVLFATASGLGSSTEPSGGYLLAIDHAVNFRGGVSHPLRVGLTFVLPPLLAGALVVGARFLPVALRSFQNVALGLVLVAVPTSAAWAALRETRGTIASWWTTRAPQGIKLPKLGGAIPCSDEALGSAVAVSRDKVTRWGKDIAPTSRLTDAAATAKLAEDIVATAVGAPALAVDGDVPYGMLEALLRALAAAGACEVEVMGESLAVPGTTSPTCERLPLSHGPCSDEGARDRTFALVDETAIVIEGEAGLASDPELALRIRQQWAEGKWRVTLPAQTTWAEGTRIAGAPTVASGQVITLAILARERNPRTVLAERLQVDPDRQPGAAPWTAEMDTQDPRAAELMGAMHGKRDELGGCHPAPSTAPTTLRVLIGKDGHVAGAWHDEDASSVAREAGPCVAGVLYALQLSPGEERRLVAVSYHTKDRPPPPPPEGEEEPGDGQPGDGQPGDGQPGDGPTPAPGEPAPGGP